MFDVHVKRFSGEEREGHAEILALDSGHLLNSLLQGPPPSPYMNNVKHKEILQ
jgi:hypothetical protein